MKKICLAAMAALIISCGGANAEDKITVWFDAGGSPG